jgi:hypothetical protein
MAWNDEYERSPAKALIDAATDPVFQSVMTPNDLESVVVDTGGGTQAQAMALKRDVARQVVQRLAERCKRSGADLKEWICSPHGFDLCTKLDSPVGELMRKLHEFIEKWLTERNMGLAHILAIPAGHLVDTTLSILCGLLVANKEIVNLCECP